MLEIAVHGHKVADETVLKTALHRRMPKFGDRIFTILNMLKVKDSSLIITIGNQIIILSKIKNNHIYYIYV